MVVARSKVIFFERNKVEVVIDLMQFRVYRPSKTRYEAVLREVVVARNSSIRGRNQRERERKVSYCQMKLL